LLVGDANPNEDQQSRCVVVVQQYDMDMKPEPDQQPSVRKVFITGASRGLGFAVAESFFADGSDLALACHKRLDLLEPFEQKKTAEQIVSTHAADLADRLRAAALVHDAVAVHHEFDAAVLCAGVTLNRLLARTTEDEFDTVMQVNLTATAVLCRELFEPLCKRQGHLVLIGTYPALTGKSGLAAYAASKAAVIGLAKTLAREYAPHVRVNVILPGYMPTDMGHSATPEAIEKAKRENLLGALSDPVEVAGFIRHLCSMRGVSGQVFNLDSRPLPLA